VDRNHVHRGLGRLDFHFFDWPALQVAAPSQRKLSPCLIDEDSPHRLGRRGELAAAIPVRNCSVSTSHVRFMNKRGYSVWRTSQERKFGAANLQLVIDDRQRCSAADGSPSSMADRIQSPDMN
jgi:hypothetical protein